MASYVEQPQRTKSAKLLGVLNLKAQHRPTFGSHVGIRSTYVQDSTQSDTVKAMKEKVLHKALHNRGSQHHSRQLQHSSVKPPRGTLSDDKLPYLDWRLSLLMLQQVKIDAKESILEYDQESNSVKIVQPMQKEQSNISNVSDSCSGSGSGSGSDSGSDLSSKQDLNILEYQSSTLYSPEDLWHSSAAKAIKLDETITQYHHSNHDRHLLINDALAAIPLLEREGRFYSSGSGHSEEDDSNDQFYEVEEGLERVRNDNQTIPAPPLLPASLFHRASFGSKSTSMVRSDCSVSMTRKMPKMFERSSSRPTLGSRSQSHNCVPTTCDDNDDAKTKATVNNFYYTNDNSSGNNKNINNNGKPKKKWTLLALHNLGVGSESLIRESEMMR